MDEKQKRYWRIRRGMNRRIAGIRTATLIDCAYIALTVLILLGLMRSTRFIFDRVYHYAARAFVIPVEAVQPVSSPSPTPILDPRVDKLRTYLELKGSPLAPHATLMVEEADRWDIGWTRLAAIAGKESSYGKRMPPGSHNAWGIGGGRFMYFASWEEGIRYAAKLLGEKYKWNENRGIQTKYCPDSDGCATNWALAVTQFSHDILKTEAK